MTNVHRLQPSARAKCGAEPSAGEVLPLPFVDLETVIESLKMLRSFPDQEVLDTFNRTPHAQPSA